MAQLLRSGGARGAADALPSGAPRGRRGFRCGLALAATGKTTSGGSRSSKTTNGRDSPPPRVEHSAKSSNSSRARGLPQRAQRVLSDLADLLTPKQAGDTADVLLMSVSMAVLVWLGMQMYRLFFFTALYTAAEQF
jgi:hypothetical protein